MPFKVYVEPEKCIGCGACTAASENFEMQGDKAVAINGEVEDVGTNQDAVESCPVDCIRIQRIIPKPE